MTNKKLTFCKKLIYGDKINPRIIFGLILSEDNKFLVFKTARNTYRINKDTMLSLEDTKKVFVVEE